MTTITMTIGTDGVSNDVVRGMITFEENSGIGTSEVIIRNDGGKWLGDFEIHDVVIISIDGESMFEGYLDDTQPYIDPDYVELDLLKVTSVDYGFDLQRKYLTKDYELSKDDDIIEDALTTASAEVSYTSSSLGDVTNYSFKRTYPTEGFKDIAEEQGKCFYVDQSKTLHYFAKDSSDEYLDGNDGRPDVNLIMDNEDPTNTVLDFKRGELNGSKLYNYVEVVAGPLMDHWSEMNADDWTETAGKGTISDSNTTPLTDYLVGRSGIKVTRTDSGPLEATLDIYNSGNGRYSHSFIDLSKNDTGSVCILANFTPLTGDDSQRTVRIQMVDSSGRTIEFKRNVPMFEDAPLHNRTDFLSNDNWVKIDFPYGVGVVVSTSTDQNEQWCSLIANATFTWAEVRQITFTTDTSVKTHNTDDSGGYIIIDGLYLPTVEVYSISQDATSISNYGERMFSQHRNDIKSQIELDALSAMLLVQKKDPLETISIICSGNTNMKYPSQTIDIEAVPKGISSLTKYRIVKLQHKFWSKSFRERQDTDYVTEVDLISQSAFDDSLRRAWSSNPMAAILRTLRGNQNSNGRQEGYISQLQPTTTYPLKQAIPMVSTAAVFPTNPAPGQLFCLTTAVGAYAAGYYYWDESLSDWVMLASWDVGNLSGVIITGQISNGFIEDSMIKANTITNSSIANSTITTDQIANSTITGSNIATKTIENSNIADSTINVADKAVVGSVTNSIIAATAVSIEKVDPAIASGAVAALYTKLTEYTRTAAGDTVGAVQYTRNDIYADPNMMYKIKHLLFLLKGDGAGGYAFGEIYPYMSDSGVLGHFSHVAGSPSNWTIQNIGNSGKQRFDTAWFSTPTYVYREAGAASSTQTGASDSDHPEVYHSYASVDATAYVQMHIANGSTPNALGSVTIQITVNGSNYTKAITGTTMTTNHLLPSDFGIDPDTIDGFGTLTEVRVIYPNTATNITPPSVWFTKVVTYTYETGNSTYQTYDSGELTINLTKGEPCNIAYYLGNGAYGSQTVYLEYPSSDVRSVGHLEAVT